MCRGCLKAVFKILFNLPFIRDFEISLKYQIHNVGNDLEKIKLQQKYDLLILAQLLSFFMALPVAFLLFFISIKVNNARVADALVEMQQTPSLRASTVKKYRDVDLTLNIRYEYTGSRYGDSYACYDSIQDISHSAAVIKKMIVPRDVWQSIYNLNGDKRCRQSQMVRFHLNYLELEQFGKTVHVLQWQSNGRLGRQYFSYPPLSLKDKARIFVKEHNHFKILPFNLEGDPLFTGAMLALILIIWIEWRKIRVRKMMARLSRSADS